MTMFLRGFLDILEMKKKYSKLVLTNDLELYIISLEKAKNSTKNKKEELYNWLKFINNPKEVTRNGR